VLTFIALSRCGAECCSADCLDAHTATDPFCEAPQPLVDAFRQHAREENRAFLLAGAVYGRCGLAEKALPIGLWASMDMTSLVGAGLSGRGGRTAGTLRPCLRRTWTTRGTPGGTCSVCAVHRATLHSVFACQGLS
jgi:hypothetical protein